METDTKKQIRSGSAVTDIEARLRADLEEAEKKAWDALARYKFQMFGYWAAIWVHLNRVGGFKLPNPFKTAVALARNRKTTEELPPLRSGDTPFSLKLKRLVKSHDDALKPIK